MQVSIETVSGLERRLTVGVPAERVDQEVEKRLKEATKTVRINGFRPGKVPLKVVKQRYGEGVRQEVLGDTINRTYQEALLQESVKPAGQPNIEATQIEEGKDIEYVATFEVYPDVELKKLDGLEVTQYEAEINASDIDAMVETLRTNKVTWDEVKRKSKAGDRVNIDFVGKKDGELFDGGSAEGHDLELGSNTMIPGFEDGIVGLKAGEVKSISVTFPEEYQVEALKGQDAEFEITVNSVSGKKLPELNEEFFKDYGVSEGGEDAFREDVKANMVREKKGALRAKVKQQIFDALKEANPIEVPQALIKSEIKVLKQQMVQQYGAAANNLDVDSLLPDDLFKEQAETRVVMGLLIAELVDQEKIEADKDRVRTLVDEIAAGYEDSQEVVNYYYSNEQALANIEGAALEEQVVDFLLEKASVTEASVSYEEAVKPANTPADA